MKFILLISVLLLNLSVALAECTHQAEVKGRDLKFIKGRVFVSNTDGRYNILNYVSKYNPEAIYKVQVAHNLEIEEINGDFTQYNKTYIEYYRYAHVQRMLMRIKSTMTQLGYQIVSVGKSLQGRELYAVYPINMSKTKKTVVMFGRHHGDEGTANWIIEGFMQELLTKNLDWFKDHQLVLYPMVNPDGAEAQTRYNANGRDLNRSWSYNPAGDIDEIKLYHAHLRTLLKQVSNISIVLDMHGSFTTDFIYRVDQNFRGRSYYAYQQQFIDELKQYDPFQFGNFEISNGDPGMARIVMVKNYGLHALTHETPRDIKLNNSRGRSKESLFDQGVAVLTSIRNLYE